VIRGAFLVLLVVLAGGCSREEAAGPPTLHLDEDVCALCGMIVSEAKFAAALVEVTDDGRTPVLFDDIGDMIVHLKRSPAATTTEFYVHDFVTQDWIAANDAWFTVSESLSTPMASGLAAFSDESAARTHVEAFPGEVLSWDQLRAR
jgi:copper chaperone NosL